MLGETQPWSPRAGQKGPSSQCGVRAVFPKHPPSQAGRLATTFQCW